MNPSAERTCVTINFYPGDCVSSTNILIFATAFTQFNPNDIGQNYLGDVGQTDTVFTFEFSVEGNEEFYFIAQQIRDIGVEDNGEGCMFTIQVGFNEVCPYEPPP